MIDRPCTRVTLADLLNLSEQRVGTLTKTGVLRCGPRGYDVRDSVRSYLAFLRSSTGGLTRERARLVKSQADLHELKLREREGELVERDAVAKKVFALQRQNRDAIQNIPSRLSGILAAESDQEVVFRVLTKELTGAMQALSESYSSTRPQRS
jgi:phage terminase Nu1 subunit (DNA packaging protein)